MLTADQFKNYVSDLRVKSNVYKQRRAELNDLKAEYGILSRTLDILKAQEKSMGEHLDRIESMQGVKGFRETREILEKISDEKAHTDEEKSRTLEEMSNLVHALNAKIAEKKVFLAPLLRGTLCSMVRFSRLHSTIVFRASTLKAKVPRIITRV